ncbi:DNA segregation ATPase FtsK/SpoIIIE, S-DNA-T family [Anaerosphaera aminiphila DSM 21120]|uniref:DNA segregation ATPase FtsK/SpoIIIE, S-DNA-T family n=1 Tax=Anaerosphaera aminiphila DSM 21120 TaxID=1120995 RepID=A0A1M5NYI8_9FIRM|nr:DNA translocase FtsK [Anaerosphaera aminiphila]SHG94548.1 DNA segregation ATPase FtsK/SpoIIIE, S-DNA-T family [Anaerosphaera aminiphila DSM 21120]
MSTKKKKKAKKKNSIVINREIISVFLIVFGILSLISIFSNKMGIIGLMLYRSFSFLGGRGNFIFPVLFIFFGFMFNSKNHKKDNKKYFISSIIISLCILVILDSTKTSELTLIDRINLSIEYSTIASSGGVIGAVLGFFLYKLFGSIGTYVLLFIVILINVFIITGQSFDSIKNYLNLQLTNYSKFKENRKIKKAEKAKNKEQQKENISEKNIIIRDSTSSKDDNVISEVEDTEINLPKDGFIDENIVEEDLVVDESDDLTFIETDEEYVFPPVEILNSNLSKTSISNKEIMENGKIIEQTMNNFGIDSKIVAINKGPVITCYELEPAPGVKLSKIVSLNDNLSMSLASSDIRIEAPIPGKSAVGIEVPNKNKEAVTIREIIETEEFKNLKSNLPLALGKDVSGSVVMSTIDKMPHLLIAGATGSGKSVCINTIIVNLIYKSSPKDVKLMLIDPKVVELNIYNGIPHLLIPVVTDPKKAAFALNWAVGEMEKRYKVFAENTVRDLASFNKKMGKLNKTEEKLPQIVIIVDELADLMMVAAREVEDYIARLAQMARAAGIHLILATQRPSVDVITGTIKANIPSRIAFSVSSAIDSRTILDFSGAEKLIGKGDMLFYPSFYSKPVRVQGAFISDEEVEAVVDFVKANSNIENNYETEINKNLEEKSKQVLDDKDPLFEDALEFILNDEQASISFLQRKLRIGYSRAARIVDQMEEFGILGPHEGSRPRKLLLSKEEVDQMMEEKDV